MSDREHGLDCAYEMTKLGMTQNKKEKFFNQINMSRKSGSVS